MKTLKPASALFPPVVILFGLVLLALLSLIGDALFAPYSMNGDVASYFDLADEMQSHHWNWVVNGYWNPLYPALLTLARLLMRVDVWHELQAARFLNVVIAVFVLLASSYLADSALRLSLTRTTIGKEPEGWARISRSTLLLCSFVITFWFIVRDMNMNAVRPDLLLTLFLLIAFASLFNIQRTSKFVYFAVLGGSFGLAFLTKSVAFPIFGLTILVLAGLGLRKRSYLLGAGVAALVFGVVAGPFIQALSKKEGHFSTGESGGANYAWYVDGAARFEQQHGEPDTKGSAIDRLKHTSKKLLANPPVFYYGSEMPGTETQWFDPSFWNAGLTPKFALGRQIRVLLGNAAMFVRLCVMNFQVFLPLILVILVGSRWVMDDWGPDAMLPAALIAVALTGLFLIVLMEGRYVAPSFILLLLGALAFAYVPTGIAARTVLSYSTAMLLAALVFGDIQSWARSFREQKEAEGSSSGSYKRQIWTGAKALISDYGIRPGDTVACYGEGACRDDVYWARLAKANIRTEVYAPQENAISEWNRDGHNPELIPALQSTGAKVLVASFSSGLEAPAGWIRLGQGDLFAIDLRLGAHSVR